MSSGTRILMKILVAVVSYGIVFALAIFALNQFNGEETPISAWIIIVILAISGYRAIKHLPFLIFFRRSEYGRILLDRDASGPESSAFCICRRIYRSLDGSEETGFADSGRSRERSGRIGCFDDFLLNTKESKI